MSKVHIKNNLYDKSLCGKNKNITYVSYAEFKNMPVEKMCKKCASRMGIYL